jgi:hypothetical protein
MSAPQVRGCFFEPGGVVIEQPYAEVAFFAQPAAKLLRDVAVVQASLLRHDAANFTCLTGGRVGCGCVVSPRPSILSVDAAALAALFNVRVILHAQPSQVFFVGFSFTPGHGVSVGRRERDAI